LQLQFVIAISICNLQILIVIVIVTVKFFFEVIVIVTVDQICDQNAITILTYINFKRKFINYSSIYIYVGKLKL
jgi:hypothetical protein